jgi:predicted nucleotidyltransferase/predicted XRE-type DNA-binding protein
MARARLSVIPPSAGVAAIKDALAARIVAALDREGLTVREAEQRTGQAAADVSRLRNGNLDRFTIDRLVTVAESLGETVALAPAPEKPALADKLPKPLRYRFRELRILCRRFKVQKLAAFGSVTREDFDEARSDLDFVVEFRRSEAHGPADQYFGFKAALERLFGRSVDLVELNAMPDSRLKRAIVREQVRIYDEVA